MSLPPRLLAVLGAECTGKTQLCTRLAQALPGVFVPEFLRQWCDARRRTPGRDEQVQIVDGHLRAERLATAQARQRGLGWVVADAGPLMTAVYSLEYFDDDSLLAAAIEHQRGYACTLVTADDIAWQSDGFMRDGPQRRATAQRRLLQLLEVHQLRFELIAGTVAEHRMARALELLRPLESPGP